MRKDTEAPSYNVVTNLQIITEIKKCKYFKSDLGFATTKDINGDRKRREDDKFFVYYNNRYRTPLFRQGYIGNIRFYIDHYIKEPLIAFYYGEEEFVFNWEKNRLSEKGIEAYLGSFLKEMQTEHDERLSNAKEVSENFNREGDASKILSNPGGVTYEDLKAYMEQRNKNRFNNQ